ncbi:MAG: aminopeptidase N, partial [Gammaproteobacteria bacterium]|nr:aminopeptidase N [Gammaproteobacteria bacterium]
MTETSQLAVHLEDYRPPSHRVDETRLTFDIRDGHTDVTSEMTLRAQSDSTTLVLDGQALQLQSVAVDGRELTGNEYAVDDQHLRIFSLPEQCTVTVKTRIEPEANTALEGLYKSSNMYCTQCEAEGFRKITYYPDRPDVLSRFTTTIVADAERYPVLLSNGNLIDESDAGDGRKRVTWRDPFPKPSYLFALVAGDLASITDTFTTASGRRVELRIYSEPHNISQCDYAMRSLKAAMRWDEERFGREYDLDIFMIVAVEDFNMGAMENKGLNVFNTSAVLASPATATDARHQRVEGVVAHEYFHNWSGNRVTCRDWFQLSLKEGFTVFRDAEFSSDMNSRTVKRIEDVEFLRTVQFDEDAGPLAHPVRPDSYVEISNFYTTTVYEKGAEVVRMLNTILGAQRFRNACDLYFERHDGQAVTTEDFVVAMEEVGETDLVQFRRWYTQSGTPVLEIRETRKNGRIELRVSQSCPATPGQASKADFHIPVAMGVVDGTGREVLGQGGLDNGYAGTIRTNAVVENPNSDGTLIVHLTDAVTDLVIENLPTPCEVSFLRGFSAPVRVDYPRSPDVLCFLAQNDTDGFARWDVAQTLSIDAMLGMLPGPEASTTGGTEIETLFAALIERALHAPDDGEAKAVLAAMLTLPSVQTLLDRAPG